LYSKPCRLHSRAQQHSFPARAARAFSFEPVIVPQHTAAPAESPPHPHVGCVPRSIPPMIAAAHPTPAVTVIAPDAQLRAQAPHSMHEARSRIWAFPALMAKTACGQTSMHSLHPLQRPGSRARVSPFFR